MPAYTQNVHACLVAKGCSGGLDDDGLAHAMADAEAAAARLRAEWRAGGHVFLDMPGRAAELGAAIDAMGRALGGASRLCVIGIGGSSLGARALAALAPHGPGQDRGISVDFLDNVDADPAWRRFVALEAVSDTAYLVVSKSGTTAETLANFLAVWQALTAAMPADAAARRCVVLTQPGDSPLRRLAETLGLAVIDHDPDLAGRYAALSPVGLVPARVAGLDVAAIRAGASEVLADFETLASEPVAGAAVQVGLMRAHDIRASVMMPYADRLGPFARWYGQIWAESLGKAGRGTMPYPARGAIDQHSQLQLWLDGPADKLFTLVAPFPGPDGQGDEPAIDTLGDPELDYLAGRTRGALLRAEYRATAQTLAGHGRPVRTFEPAPDVPAETVVGALTMHFMIETAVAGYMLGVDPFDQPAVDEGKALARQFLSDSG